MTHNAETTDSRSPSGAAERPSATARTSKSTERPISEPPDLEPAVSRTSDAEPVVTEPGEGARTVQAGAPATKWPTRLFAEFAVVFLGVYGAFFLDGCRENQRNELRRTQILDTLREDFADGRESIVSLKQWFEESLGGPVLDRMANGEQPPLLPIPLPTAMESDSWNAVLAGGGLDVLETRLVRDVERSIAVTAMLGATAEQYNDYVRTVLVPNLDLGRDEFFEGETGRLRTKYLWYFYSLQGYRETLAQLEKEFDQVEATLEDPS